MNQQDQQVHLIKLQLMNKGKKQVRIQCNYTQTHPISLSIRQKRPLYIPLINKISINNNLVNSNNKQRMIPIELKQFYDHPFDKHNLKIQTYEDDDRRIKGEIINLHLQFSLQLISKNQTNYVTVFFKQAELRKDLKLFGKMSPYIVLTNDNWKYKSQPIKDGHLTPKFQQQVSIPFNSVFDRIFLQIKHDGERIGSDQISIFELFGTQQLTSRELKTQFKIVGSWTFSVTDFFPEDF